MSRTRSATPSYKLKFTMEQNMKGGFSSRANKAANKFVTEKECDEFIDRAHKQLEDIRENWKKVYKKEGEYDVVHNLQRSVHPTELDH